MFFDWGFVSHWLNKNTAFSLGGIYFLSDSIKESDGPPGCSFPGSPCFLGCTPGYFPDFLDCTPGYFPDFLGCTPGCTPGCFPDFLGCTPKIAFLGCTPGFLDCFLGEAELAELPKKGSDKYQQQDPSYNSGRNPDDLQDVWLGLR